MALFEPTSSRSGSRFGKLSSNMFFTRNTAKPKRVRHIEGLNGALICNVNDDPSLIHAASTSALSFNKTNLPSLESSRRVERLVPPMGFWNTYGIVHDTDRWRQELAVLANASGLGIEKDEQKHHNKPAATADSQHASRSGAHYSSRTGRFNEGTAKSRGRTGSKHSAAYSDMLFNVPENEREMWMLQVLCQLLGTSNLEDVQSWLVSASHTEKEQARTMINSALQGLKESDRTSNQSQQPINLDSLSDFVEKQKKEEKQASQKYVKESLNRSGHALQSINEEEATESNSALKKHSSLPLINTTTYQLSFPNYSQSPSSSLNAITSNNKNNLFNENDQNQYKDDHEEQIETIQLDEDCPRPQSASFANNKKQSKQTPLGRSYSSQQQQHRVESFQLNDDDDNNSENKQRNNESPNDDDDLKTRRIRELQTKLSRQELESKKQINELQTKQSRLENALKLIVKQTAYGKRRQQTHDDNDSASVVNNESPKDDDHYQYDKQQETNSQQKLSNINKSRDDNRSTKSFSGVWKPDTSVLNRLQGN